MEESNNPIRELEQYLPESYVPLLKKWFSSYGGGTMQVVVKAVKDRNTKLGDYRPPHKGKPHRITVNRGLNPYSFMITLVHEFAHLLVWEKHKNRVQPHGIQWKEIYALLLTEVVAQKALPADIEKAVSSHANKITASSYSDHELIRTLRQYEGKEKVIHLEDIPEKTPFRLKNGKVFIKGKKARKRYFCQAYKSKRIYYVSAVAEVELVKPD